MSDENIRKQFPILDTKVNGNPLIYFDNAATTQKPFSVIDAVTRVYTEKNGSLHRSAHYLARQAELIYKELQTKLFSFFNATPAIYDVVITKNTTEAINLFAQSFFYHSLITKKQPTSKNTILVSEQEHNSNLLPWLRLHNDFGAKVLTIPNRDDETIDSTMAKKMINLYRENLALISLTHVSNVIGKVNDVSSIIEAAHEFDIPVLIDGAQSAGHIPVSLNTLQPDMYVASGHKMYGPAGIGFIFIKKEIMKKMAPFLVGGGMIESLNNYSFTSREMSDKFMAGTQNVEAMAGLGAALDFLSEVGMKNVQEHEQELVTYFLERFKKFPIEIIGGEQVENKIGIFSFTAALHPHDLADLFDEQGIAVRAGNHCAHMLHQKKEIPVTTRVSFGIYNTVEEIEKFAEVFEDIISHYESAK